MNRLQKKCLIASAGFHGLLLVILIFGAALMPEDKASNLSRITFFDPSKITDGLTQGGSSEPNPAPPAQPPVLPPQPPASVPVLPPTAQPPPQPVRRETTPPPDDFKPAPAKDAESFKPVKPKTPQTDEFTPVNHPPVKPVASNNSAADARAKAIADNQRRIANQINRGIKNLSSNLSKATAVETSTGDDSGAAAANYGDIVQSMYFAAWNQPASVDDSATVLVSVTISRDGHVTRHEVIKSSGNAVMDRSIENTLDNVTEIAPFPEGAKDTERTYTIKFNLSAKRLSE